MRITGGILRGRRLRVPRGIRPTQDRVREALFSALADRLVDARVLDLYAGTGALGLEAWSRGAAEVVCVEQDPAAYRALRRNLEELCGTRVGRRVAAVRMEVHRYLRGRAEGARFDLVFADPPYARGGEGRQPQKTLRLIRDRHILAPTGVLVYEQSGAEPLSEPPGWVVRRHRRYGTTCLVFYSAADEPANEEET